MEANNMHFTVGSDASLTAWYYSAGVKVEACKAKFESKKVATAWLRVYSTTARAYMINWICQGMPAKLIKEVA